ncbi:hypothetical protein MUCCIDRAFT_110892 [Mucor lusitanicus CBS 277.49]|uniref:Uncharacterized protein n=1 Tax=Mucor lusitanicus CBS 277.49 TaxID=747725 RepID=A0A168LVS9_MUCCL|nr:hypothetical protein MUCCIDRAFT_110892 [Mucor lusitanicus CBS 277.49]
MHTHTFAAYVFIAITSLVAQAKAGIIGGYHKASGEERPGLLGKRSLTCKLRRKNNKK